MNCELFILDELCTLQRHLARGNKLIQIARDEQGEEGWRSDLAPHIAALYGEEHLPLVSPKQFFFADHEPLYEFDGETFAPLHPQVEATVLFGVQACDLTAIAYQDRFFKDDPNYQARRAQTLLVGIDCSAPCAKGFCHLVDAGPQAKQEYADLILTNLASKDQDAILPSSWSLMVTSEKGKAALQGLALLKAPLNFTKLRSELRQRVIETFEDFSYINKGIEQINKNRVPPALWEELSVRCLGCSGCTNLCPTCSCYSTYQQFDVQTAKTTTLRIWDSCQFEGFQREASGHNPSHEAAQRTERYWYHKFSDDYLPEFGRYGCVGCGRCEQTCPGSIGVHTVMGRIEQVCCN